MVTDNFTATDRYGAGVDGAGVRAESAEVVTHRHIARVRQLLGEAACELIRRGDAHDASKFDPVELGPLQAMQDVIAHGGQAPYGSDEYKRRTAMLGPMITHHHHQRNSHHPEHYPNGIAGMDLFDLVEMFFDWKAASERSGESTIGLSHSIKRFGIDPQLASILKNTAERLGYRTDIEPTLTTGGTHD